MATVVWPEGFSKFRFSCIFNKNFSFFFAIFTLLVHSNVYLVGFTSFLINFDDFTRYMTL